MATEFSDLTVFDLYIVTDGHPRLQVSSVEFAAVQRRARIFSKRFPDQHWIIRRSQGDPDPVVDLLIAERYHPIAATMQADQQKREQVFA